MTSVFSFCLRADNLEFGHINQVLFSLVTPVANHCCDDLERGSLMVEESDDDDADSAGVRKRPPAFHHFVSQQLFRGFSSLGKSML